MRRLRKRRCGPTQSQAQQSGKLEAVYAGASKLVIDGVTYAYNPLTTVVMVNGKRSTISDVRVAKRYSFRPHRKGHTSRLC